MCERTVFETVQAVIGADPQITAAVFIDRKDNIIGKAFRRGKGGEFSYESDTFLNGLFTEEIIKALSEGKADKDRNGIVSTDELRDYVSIAVPKHCMGMQNPTVDRDNIFMKFGFPIVQ